MRHLRTSIKNVAWALGGMRVLAHVTALSAKTLAQAAYNRRDRPSIALALLVARAAGSTLEAMLSGRLTPAGSCPHCGAERRAS